MDTNSSSYLSFRSNYLTFLFLCFRTPSDNASTARRSHATQALDSRLAVARGVRDQPGHHDRQRRAADARASAARIELATARGGGRVQTAVRRFVAGGRHPLGSLSAEVDVIGVAGALRG